MAHPLKAEVQRARSNRNKEGVAGHNAKLRKLTTHYGAADPAMYQTAQGDLENGPQTDYGFGTEGEGEASVARSDRPRRSSAANPIATYKRGGRVHEKDKARKRADGGDVSSIEEANRDQAMATPSRARGGRTNKKGATHVNVIVAPQSGNQPMTPPPVLPIGANPAIPPAMPPGPMAGSPMGGPPGGPMMPPPPGLPPPGAMAPRKRGGRVAHSDEREDEALIHRMVKPTALKRARGGTVRMTAGAESGPGRLEKTHARAKRQGGDKSAEL